MTAIEVEAVVVRLEVLLELPKDRSVRQDLYGTVDPAECAALDIEAYPKSFLADNQVKVTGIGRSGNTDSSLVGSLRAENLALREALAYEALVVEGGTPSLASLEKSQDQTLAGSVERMRKVALGDRDVYSDRPQHRHSALARIICDAADRAEADTP